MPSARPRQANAANDKNSFLIDCMCLLPSAKNRTGSINAMRPPCEEAFLSKTSAQQPLRKSCLWLGDVATSLHFSDALLPPLAPLSGPVGYQNRDVSKHLIPWFLASTDVHRMLLISRNWYRSSYARGNGTDLSASF